jgi:hypothetical protein
LRGPKWRAAIAGLVFGDVEPLAEALESAERRRDSLGQEQAAAKVREAREKAREILSAGWPKAPNALSGQLKRAGPALRKIAIAIDWPSRHGEEKNITIVNSFETQGRRSSQASQGETISTISMSSLTKSGTIAERRGAISGRSGTIVERRAPAAGRSRGTTAGRSPKEKRPTITRWEQKKRRH